MIGSVDVGVTIQASPADHPSRVRRTCHGLMPALDMATLTEPRHLGLQHSCVYRSMRLVAHHAVFAHRTMLPQHGSPLLGVTLITFFIDRICADQFIALGAVRVVTVGTGDLALRDGMPRTLMHHLF